MRSPCCLCAPSNAYRPEETAVDRQRLSKHVSAATNTHATIEQLLDEVFCMRSLSYQILNI
jgi:hypothetical protein